MLRLSSRDIVRVLPLGSLMLIPSLSVSFRHPS